MVQIVDAPERAALELAEACTIPSDGSPNVPDDVWARVRKHHDDDQPIAFVALIAMINANNRLSLSLGYRGGSYEPGMFAMLSA